MNKYKKYLTLPLLLPALLSCSTAKMQKPNFRNKGILVDSDYFYTKLENHVDEVGSFLNTDNINKSSNLQMTFRVQTERKHSNSKPLSYTVFTDISGKLIYDSTNLRFRLDIEGKGYVKNHIKGNDLDVAGLEEGPYYEKSRLYGETLNGKTYIYDLDYKITRENSIDLLSNAIPSSVNSVYSLDSSFKNSKILTYINNNKIFTINATYSNSSTQLEETYQLIFSNGLRILVEENLFETYGQDKTSITTYADIKVKPFLGSINKVRIN